MSQTSNSTTPAETGWLENDFQRDDERNIWALKTASGGFGYSDGDRSENYVLSVIQNATDTSVMSDELAAGMKDWPSTYHLHHQRANLLRAVSDHLSGPILEIGAGCGLLTRFMGEEGHQVFALEGSGRRAATIGARCRDLDNVTVINANLQDLKTDQKFQTITLIGVLEYARVYFSDGSDSDPIDQMLQYVADHLTDDGVLILAIENQLGLKYFAGYAEDHLNYPMAGIEGHYTDKSVVTFGREVLANRLRGVGLTAQRFAYPFPDYKFPEAVLFDPAMTPDMGGRFAALVAGAAASDRQKPKHLHFALSKALQPIMENGLGGDVANSFLVVASKSDITASANDYAVYYGNGDRKKHYLKRVAFQGSADDIVVDRQRLTGDPQPQNEDLTQILEREPFLDGQLWTQALHDIMARDKWRVAEVTTWAQRWIAALGATVGIDTASSLDSSQQISGKWLDAIPKNMILDKANNAHFVDLEWHQSDDIPFGYLIVRGLSDAFNLMEMTGANGEIHHLLTLVRTVCHQLKMPLSETQITSYWDQEAALQRKISTRPGKYRRNQMLKTRVAPQAALKAVKRHGKRDKAVRIITTQYRTLLGKLTK